MNPVRREEILPVAEFVADRQRHLSQVLSAQAARRVALGPNMTLLFENRTTVRWQVHEMCRVEGLHGDAVLHELHTYNALLPKPDALSATLLVEYPEPVERDRMVRLLLGLHQHVWLEAAGRRWPASFDGEQFNDQRISAVQFLRIPLDPIARQALGTMDQPVRLVADHPHYSHQVELSRSTRGALLDDLDEAAASST